MMDDKINLFVPSSMCPHSLQSLGQALGPASVHLKGHKDKKSLQLMREGSILRIGGFCKNL